MSSTGRSLGPGWRSGGGGKGFQPPPAAEASPDAEVVPRSPTSRNRAGSHASADSGGWNEVGSGGKPKGGGGSNINHFAALSLDDDGPSSASGGGVNKTANGAAGMGSPSRRSDALRQASFGAGQGGSGAGGGGGGGPAKRSGRSLADLAASIGPSDSSASGAAPGGAGRGGPGDRDRRSGPGPRGTAGGPRGDRGGGERRPLPEFEWDKSIVRYTREKLLSLRPSASGGGGELPAKLQHLEGVSVINDKASDPGKDLLSCCFGVPFYDHV
jgi:hypothetical protein